MFCIRNLIIITIGCNDARWIFLIETTYPALYVLNEWSPCAILSALYYFFLTMFPEPAVKRV